MHKKIILNTKIGLVIFTLLFAPLFTQEMEVDGDLRVTGKIIFNDGTTQSTSGLSPADAVLETRMYTLEDVELRHSNSNNLSDAIEFNILEITGFELNRAKVEIFGISNVTSNVNHFDFLVHYPSYNTQSYYLNNYDGISHSYY